jgi:hypothetical protein
MRAIEAFTVSDAGVSHNDIWYPHETKISRARSPSDSGRRLALAGGDGGFSSADNREEARLWSAPIPAQATAKRCRLIGLTSMKIEPCDCAPRSGKGEPTVARVAIQRNPGNRTRRRALYRFLTEPRRFLLLSGSHPDVGWPVWSRRHPGMEYRDYCWS